MAETKVLIIEDEEDILELIAYNLKAEGYSPVKAVSGEKGLEKALSERPAIVMLDLMLPGIDGLEVLRRLKGNHDMREIPVVIVSAKGEEVDVVTGLELGADDYVAKPFRPRELIARVRAVLRARTAKPNDSEGKVVASGIEIDPARREVIVDGERVDLTFTEFEVLKMLAKRPGLVFTRYQIVDAVRGDDYAVTDRSVDVQIVGLRKKLGELGKLIQTVRGVGYRFRDAEE